MTKRLNPNNPKIVNVAQMLDDLFSELEASQKDYDIALIDLSNLLFQLRTDLNLTQEEAADRAYVSLETVKKFESCEYDPPFTQMMCYIHRLAPEKKISLSIH